MPIQSDFDAVENGCSFVMNKSACSENAGMADSIAERMTIAPTAYLSGYGINASSCVAQLSPFLLPRYGAFGCDDSARIK